MIAKSIKGFRDQKKRILFLIENFKAEKLLMMFYQSLVLEEM